jgi:outer membrane lipoprotein-sorting protein
MAVIPAGVLLIAATQFAQAPASAQAVFDGMIEALGGAAFRAVKDMEASGRYFNFRRNEIVASDVFVDYIKFPDMERTEFGKDRQKTVRINNGAAGWTIGLSANGRNGSDVQPQPASETEEFVKNFQTSFDYVVRFVVTQPRTTLLYTGSEVTDGKRLDVLEIRDPEKNLMRIYVDRDTRLPRKVQRRRAGSAVLREEQYANWHEFDGVMTPLMVVTYSDGAKVMEIRAEKVKYNSDLPDSLFSPPETASR